MKNKYVYTGILIGLILVFWYAFGRSDAETTDIFTEVNEGRFEVIVTTTGELRAKNSTQILGPQNSRDIRIHSFTIQNLIPEGTQVQKGDFVAELDRSEIMNRLQDQQLTVQAVESQYEQAQLDSSLTLSQARNALINLEYTVEENKIAVEQSKFESPAVQRQAEIAYERSLRQLEQEQKAYVTKVKQAEARLREIETDLTKERNDLKKIQDIMRQFTIYAPENGMVIYRRSRGGQKTTIGSQISAWDPVVAELPDFSAFESVTYVNEVDIQKVKRGQQAIIGLDAITDKTLTGVVTSVANVGEQRPNSDSKVFEVVIEAGQADTTLRPAMTTSNRILISSVPSATYIPLESIHTADSFTYVFKQEGLKPVMQQVILGAMNENDVIVREGLTPGERIYLSLPSDTAGIAHNRLPEEIMEKYREEAETQEDTVRPSIQPDMEMQQDSLMRQFRMRRQGDGTPPPPAGRRNNQ